MSTKKEIRANPLAKRIFWAVVVVFAGLFLVLQPWVLALKLLGGVFMVMGIMVTVPSVERAVAFSRMKRRVIARFPEGIVMDGGAIYDDQVHFLNDQGVRLVRCETEKDKLYMSYTFIAKKVRLNVDMEFTISDDNAQGAQDVLKRYGVIEAPKDEILSDEEALLPSEDEQIMLSEGEIDERTGNG